MSDLWIEKYRPKTINEYVFKDPTQKSQVESWIKDKTIPHLLLSGSAGIGKTTLAKVLVNEIGINEYDFMEINASRSNSIEDVRNKITNFVQMIPFGDFKVVLLDEADFISLSGQAALRGILEAYYNTARFIFTCNEPRKIMPAIHSRCQGFHFEKIDITEYTARVASILISEEIEFELDVLDTYVKASYPDLRKCINSVQQFSTSGTLLSVKSTNTAGSADYKLKMVDLFKQGKISDARKLLCGNISPDEIEDVFVWCYQNIEFFGSDEETQDKAVLIIKDGLVDHTIISDPEINLAAVLIKLSRLQK